VEGEVEGVDGEVEVGCGEGEDGEGGLPAGAAFELRAEEEQAAADGREVEADRVEGVGQYAAEDGEEKGEIGGHGDLGEMAAGAERHAEIGPGSIVMADGAEVNLGLRRVDGGRWNAWGMWWYGERVGFG
jgi:hypothetical protein